MGALLQRVREDLSEPFEIEPGVVLPVRRYEWNQLEARFSSFQGRRLSASAAVALGGFYSGRKRTLELSGDLRLGRHFILRPGYELNDVDLAEGAFQTHLFGLRSELAFNRDLVASVDFQYNSAGDLAALQVRLEHVFRNIDSFFLVYEETRSTAGPSSSRSDRSLVAKLSYSVNW